MYLVQRIYISTRGFKFFGLNRNELIFGEVKKMKENDYPGEILDTLWKLEKIGIDFHGREISWKQFKKIFTVDLLKLVGLLIELELLKQK